MNATPRPAINLEALARAVDSLRDALAQPQIPYTRDASIHRFKYTFDLCWKMLRRYLAAESAVETFSLKDVFREARRQGILADVEVWFTYLKARILTSHTYNEKPAKETYLIAAAFLPDAQALLDELRKRIGGGSRTD